MRGSKVRGLASERSGAAREGQARKECAVIAPASGGGSGSGDAIGTGGLGDCWD